ncbi:MAG: type II/IV secretion system protein [Opitutaceae bacterium]|nr:type II/IV secretion system protein [Opitutaceae bacterium]
MKGDGEFLVRAAPIGSGELLGKKDAFSDRVGVGEPSASPESRCEDGPPAIAWSQAESLAHAFGLPVALSLSRGSVAIDALDRMPADFARRNQVVPIEAGRSFFRFAISNPFDQKRIDAVRELVGVEIEPVLAPAAEIERAIAEFYDIECKSVGEEAGPGPAEYVEMGLGDVPKSEGLSEGGLSNLEDEPISELVRKLFTDALDRRASDIHLEPLGSFVRIRNRVDGVLHEVGRTSATQYSSIVARIKILSRLSIAERRRPQDGRLRQEYKGIPVDLRVSVIPTTHGESVVMRMHNDTGSNLGLSDLGFDRTSLDAWSRLTSRGDGLLLVTGPTGSGKSTTLYGVLNSLNVPGRKIVTVEDPVEYQMQGINQVPVRPEIGMTFARAMRALLRQAPNILMVGEIRDRETADLAANAGMSGHLVLSTLHTNDACGAITRLRDLGVKPFMISAGLKGVLAQRLVRRICPHCRIPHALSPTNPRVTEGLDHGRVSIRAFKGAGCDKCSGSGYSGRIGLFELLEIDPGIHESIHDGSTEAQLRARWRNRGGRTLREDGFAKVNEGLTTLEEVLSNT